MFERVFNRLGHGSVAEKIEEEEEMKKKKKKKKKKKRKREEEESRLTSVQGER